MKKLKQLVSKKYLIKKINNELTNYFHTDFYNPIFDNLWYSEKEVKIGFTTYIISPRCRYKNDSGFYWDENNPNWEDTWHNELKITYFPTGLRYKHKCKYCEHDRSKEIIIDLGLAIK